MKLQHSVSIAIVKNKLPEHVHSEFVECWEELGTVRASVLPVTMECSNVLTDQTVLIKHLAETNIQIKQDTRLLWASVQSKRLHIIYNPIYENLEIIQSIFHTLI